MKFTCFTSIEGSDFWSHSHNKASKVAGKKKLDLKTTHNKEVPLIANTYKCCILSQKILMSCNLKPSTIIKIYVRNQKTKSRMGEENRF